MVRGTKPSFSEFPWNFHHVSLSAWEFFAEHGRMEIKMIDTIKILLERMDAIVPSEAFII